MKNLLLLLAVTASAATSSGVKSRGGAPGQSQQERARMFKTLDQGLDEIDGMIRRLEQDRTPSPILFYDSYNAAKAYKVTYHACRAIATSNVRGECSKLGGGDGSSDVSDSAMACGDAYELGRWARGLLLRRSSFVDECVVGVGDRATPEERRQACSQILAGYKSPDALCQTLRNEHYLSPRQPCRFRAILGDKSGCLAGDGPAVIPYCFDVIYFRQAALKNDVGECGTSSVCRVLMGQGIDVCEPDGPKNITSPSVIRDRLRKIEQAIARYRDPDLAARQKRLQAQRKHLDSVEAALKSQL